MEVVHVKFLVYIYKASLIIYYISYYRRILTETETQLITQKRFHELVEQQKKLDAEIDAQLSRQEDDLRLEEEAYFEAKREAARVAKQSRQMEVL